MWWFEASPRRAASKSQTFITRTAPHQGCSSYIKLPSAFVAHREFWIQEIYSTLYCHDLHHEDNLVKTFEPELTAQQQQVLDLLGLPHRAYTQQA